MTEKNIFAKLPEFEFSESENEMLRVLINNDNTDFIMTQIKHLATMHGIAIAKEILNRSIEKKKQHLATMHGIAIAKEILSRY
jgi:nitrate reductase NapAB chaperone NapD